MARSKKAQAAIDGALSIDAPASSVGLGIDLVEIARMRRILERTPSFAGKCFSPDEVERCNRSVDPAKGFAARFAAKEAAVKALGTGFSGGIGIRDIEVISDKRGRPTIALYGRAREVADEMGVKEMALSMSHTESDAVACVIAMTEGSSLKMQKKETPVEELTRRFKETRGMLDDLGKPDAGTEAAGAEAAGAAVGAEAAGVEAPGAGGDAPSGDGGAGGDADERTGQGI